MTEALSSNLDQCFYRVIRSQIFRVLMTLFGKMATLSYNKGTYFGKYIAFMLFKAC